MPRYFFDTHDGRDGFHDEVGVELAETADVAHEAFDLLRDLSHRAAPGGETVLTTSVRDRDGTVVFRATMTIAIDVDSRAPDRTAPA